MNGAVHGEAIDDGEHARRERVRDRDSHASTPQPRWQQRAELEDARQVQRHHEEQQRERADDRRRLQLEAPAELLAGGAQRRRSQRRAATNATMTPAANARPSRRTQRGCARPVPASASAFSDSTGKTQGIRFSSSPPPSANAQRERQRQRGRGAAPSNPSSAALCGLGACCTAFRRQRRRARQRCTTRRSTRKPGVGGQHALQPREPGASSCETGSVKHRAAIALRDVAAVPDGSISRSRSAKKRNAPLRLVARSELQRDRRAGRRRLRLPRRRRRARQRIARRCDARPQRASTARRAATGRVEREVGALRDARLLADEPVGACGERRGRCLTFASAGTVSGTRWNTSPSYP